MKFQVSMLSDKGTKKTVLTVDADRMEEETGSSNGLFSSQTRLYFYADEIGWWSNRQTLVASALVSGGYVVEEVVG